MESLFLLERDPQTDSLTLNGFPPVPTPKGWNGCPTKGALKMENIKKESKTAIDPVCGMEIQPDNFTISTTYMGQPYHFCTESCLKKFKEDEKRFSAQKQGGKKGWWVRYLEKLKKQEGDIRSCCH